MISQEKLRQSLNKNELYEFMIGESGYAYPNPYADMPTNPHDVFDSFKNYYSQTKSNSVWEKYCDNVLKMSVHPDYA
jgi:hypothetical protein